MGVEGLLHCLLVFNKEVKLGCGFPIRGQSAFVERTTEQELIVSQAREI